MNGKYVIGVDYGTDSCRAIIVNCATGQKLSTAVSRYPRWKEGLYCDASQNRYRQHPLDYTAYEGGTYSSEWVWAKILHILREDDAVRDAAYSWVEHCDWMVALVTGNTKPEKLLRSRCAAGHKAMWSELWGGLPSGEFLVALDPLLSGMRERLFSQTYTGNVLAGKITVEWSQRLGLPEGIAVSVGMLDAHAGAVGACIKPNVLTRIIGTSTCDISISSHESMAGKLIEGICGQVDGSVIPGYIGLEAGQSAFGDIYAWFKGILSYPLKEIIAKSTLIDSNTKEALIEEAMEVMLSRLTEDSESLGVRSSAPIALDWMNGRRTPDADQSLKGAIAELTLSTSAPMIFRALVEATAFGSKAIVDRFRSEGIRIDSVTAIGGIAHKSPFVMQTLSDVLNMPINVVRSQQTCALGAAMFAAVAAGIFENIEQAQESMGSGIYKTYFPRKEESDIYLELYQKYRILGKLANSKSNK